MNIISIMEKIFIHDYPLVDFSLKYKKEKFLFIFWGILTLQKTALCMLRSLSLFFIPRNFLYKLKLKMVLKVWPKKLHIPWRYTYIRFNFKEVFFPAQTSH